eukprot:764172-Hanusia_phi.AAC.3
MVGARQGRSDLERCAGREGNFSSAPYIAVLLTKTSEVHAPYDFVFSPHGFEQASAAKSQMAAEILQTSVLLPTVNDCLRRHTQGEGCTCVSCVKAVCLTDGTISIPDTGCGCTRCEYPGCNLSPSYGDQVGKRQSILFLSQPCMICSQRSVLRATQEKGTSPRQAQEVTNQLEVERDGSDGVQDSRGRGSKIERRREVRTKMWLEGKRRRRRRRRVLKCKFSVTCQSIMNKTKREIKFSNGVKLCKNHQVPAMQGRREGRMRLSAGCLQRQQERTSGRMRQGE